MAEESTYYTVQSGDTLLSICQNLFQSLGYSSVSDMVTKVMDLNGFSGLVTLVKDLKLKLTGEAADPTPVTVQKATINVFGIISTTERSMYASWKFDPPQGSEVSGYEIKWYYMVKVNSTPTTFTTTWLIGNEATTEETSSTYSPPENAISVRFKVKPVAANASKWTASWESKDFSFEAVPVTPALPSVEIDKYKLTMENNNVDFTTTQFIEYQISKDNGTVFNQGKASVIAAFASYSCQVEAGHSYRVRCRGVNNSGFTSNWTEYTDNYDTIPSAPESIVKCSAASKTSVELEWTQVQNADEYEIEYTTKKTYFDRTQQTQPISGIIVTNYEITGLDPGEEYFFRVRALNNAGESEWSEIKSTILGSIPDAPTTWSSTTTAIVGDSLTLYWVHNAEDNSRERAAQIELIVNGITQPTITVTNPHADDDTPVVVGSYSINTNSYSAGANILWRVRTCGITNEYGDDKWSIQRNIDLYAPPVLSLHVSSTIDSFPINVRAESGPSTQTPISYNITILANETYETTNNFGDEITIVEGSEVYSKNFDIDTNLNENIYANEVSLENSVSYTLICKVSMNSGLTAEESRQFRVVWDPYMYDPTAEIIVDKETLTASIRPFCNGNPLLSIYRREYDGKFVTIAEDLDGNQNTFVTDPHPSLDYARYRVVAKDRETGRSNYYDIPGIEVGEKSVVIQWDDKWVNFDTVEGEFPEEKPWTGSMLKLRYNIDITNTTTKDTEFVSYAGRESSVSYYGTHIDETLTWNIDIPKNDMETLYAIRRLSKYMGNVYIRDQYGVGFWAEIEINYSQRHIETITPITINIKRVEGGA